jgi:hypothetical protein
MLALSAALAGVASAATTPEFKPVPVKKTVTSSGGAVTFESGAELVACSKSSSAGEVASAKALGKVVITLTGCSFSDEVGGCSVHSAKAKEGEIVTKDLVGELGTVSTQHAPSGVGVLLKAESGSTWLAFEGSCVSGEALRGSVAGAVATVGSKLAANEIKFALAGAKQAITEITLDSGEVVKPSLMDNDLSTGTFQWADPLAFEEAVEVT